MAGIADFIAMANQAGIPLVLLWLLTMAVVWGLLQHANVPKSAGARGAISIVAAFLVLLTAGSVLVNFMESLITAVVIIAIGLLIAVMFLEIAGVKAAEGKKLFEVHPKFFGGIILVLLVLIFIGAGALNILNIPNIQITDTLVAIIVFVGVMLAAIYFMMSESKDDKGKK